MSRRWSKRQPYAAVTDDALHAMRYGHQAASRPAGQTPDEWTEAVADLILAVCGVLLFCVGTAAGVWLGLWLAGVP